jgi:ribonuclease BN (tRNA processing enzyme)
MRRLRFIGSGDAFGSGGRYHTCFLVERERPFLIDFGASSLIALKRWGVDPNAIGTILVTHLHGDHFGGLPFLLLDAHLVSRRTAPLTIAGPPGFRDRLHTAMECFFPGSTGIPAKFELTLLELEPERRVEIDGLVVTPYEVRHFSGAPPFAYRIESGGKVLAYSGDTEWADSLVPAARGADLFISEAYFFDKKVKWHIDYKTLAARLEEIGAKRVILTHMSAELLARLGEVALETAEDGKWVEI